MISFPMTIHEVRAEAADGTVKASPIASARPAGLLLDRIAGPIPSSSQLPLLTVAVPQRHTVSFPRGGSMIHPKAPNIHTRPKKKKSASWWPFGHK